MTPARLYECLSLLRWSQQGLALALGYASHTSVRQWLTGRARVPADVAIWLETLATFHARHPPPSR
jgi:DNA-binding transcriptional regulator YdaS (Cro superfamily)